MPVDPNPELLMSLSADVMLQILGNPNVDPGAPGIPELAFTQAARLVTHNLEYQQSYVTRQDQKRRATH
jgi:hypothetical protein